MNAATHDRETGPGAGDATIVHGPAAMRERLCALVERAGSLIQAIGPAFEPLLFNTSALTDALARFVTRRRGNRIELAVEDPRQVLRDNARLVGVLQKLSDFAELRALGEEDRGGHDLFVCADRARYLHQLDVARPECVVADDAPENALLLAHRFDTAWQRAAPVAVSRTLGL